MNTKAIALLLLFAGAAPLAAQELTPMLPAEREEAANAEVGLSIFAECQIRPAAAEAEIQFAEQWVNSHSIDGQPAAVDLQNRKAKIKQVYSDPAKRPLLCGLVGSPQYIEGFAKAVKRLKGKHRKHG